MDLRITFDEFVSWVAKVLNVQPLSRGADFEFKLQERRHAEYNVRNLTVLVDKSVVQAAIIDLTDKSPIEEAGIANDCYLELVVREESSFPRVRRLHREDLCLEDGENGLTYRICPPSDALILFLLHGFAEVGALRDLRLNTRPLYRHSGSTEEDVIGIFDILRHTAFPLSTLQVTSSRKRSVKELNDFANSVFFQISYNLDVALVPQRNLSEFIRSGRIMRLRRLRIEQMDPPRLIYTPDLVYHYQSAVAADNPSLQFLSFYHVAEHFFEAVFKDDLIERVRTQIIQPDFSSKRKRDIEKLIREVSSSLRFQQERVVFNELEALRLTMDRHAIDPGAIAAKVDEYDDSLVDYYRTTPVSFSRGNAVDLKGEDRTEVLKHLAARVYKTRNAIVHSKESEKSRYVPFEHDRILAKELPLIRFIAESIILADAKQIP